MSGLQNGSFFFGGAMDDSTGQQDGSACLRDGATNSQDEYTGLRDGTNLQDCSTNLPHDNKNPGSHRQLPGKSQSLSSFFTTFYCLLESIMISSLMMTMAERYAITDAGKKSAAIFRWFVFRHEHSSRIAYTRSEQVLPCSEKSYYQTNRTEHNTCSKTKFLHNSLKNTILFFIQLTLFQLYSTIFEILRHTYLYAFTYKKARYYVYFP